jgi:hypothetical protein
VCTFLCPSHFLGPICILSTICSAVPCLKGGYSQGVDFVVYRPIAKQRLCKQRQFLGNVSVNTFTLLGSRFLIIIMQQLDYNNGNCVFLRGPCRDVISKWQSQLIVLYGGLWREDLSSWSWRITTVKAVARERLMKTQQAGKRLAGAVVICEL